MQDNLRYFPSARLGRGARRADVLAAVLAVVEAWLSRRQQRRALLELSEHMLKDIGISRSEAFREGRKPFWRA